MNVYIWTSGELKNAYIGEVWTPDASRTLLYLPLESDTNDYSGNSRTCTPTSVTFTTVGWVKSAHVWTTGWIALPDFINKNTSSAATLSILLYVTSQTTSSRRYFWEYAVSNSSQFYWLINSNVSYYTIWGVWTSTSSISSDSWTVEANKWNNIVYTADSTEQCLYINWEKIATWTGTSYPRWNPSTIVEQWKYLLCPRQWVSNWTSLNWNAREIIWENKKWTPTQVSNYYNQIKQQLWF